MYRVGIVVKRCFIVLLVAVSMSSAVGMDTPATGAPRSEADEKRASEISAESLISALQSEVTAAILLYLQLSPDVDMGTATYGGTISEQGRCAFVFTFCAQQINRLYQKVDVLNEHYDVLLKRAPATVLVFVLCALRGFLAQYAYFEACQKLTSENVAAVRIELARCMLQQECARALMVLVRAYGDALPKNKDLLRERESLPIGDIGMEAVLLPDTIRQELWRWLFYKLARPDLCLKASQHVALGYEAITLFGDTRGYPIPKLLDEGEVATVGHLIALFENERLGVPFGMRESGWQWQVAPAANRARDVMVGEYRVLRALIPTTVDGYAQCALTVLKDAGVMCGSCTFENLRELMAQSSRVLDVFCRADNARAHLVDLLTLVFERNLLAIAPQPTGR